MRKFWQSIQEVGMLNGDRDLRNLEGGRLASCEFRALA